MRNRFLLPQYADRLAWELSCSPRFGKLLYLTTCCRSSQWTRSGLGTVSGRQVGERRDVGGDLMEKDDTGLLHAGLQIAAA